jgi:hypothetical protein
MDSRQVAAADFKANCLRMMDEVARERIPIIITKGGGRWPSWCPFREKR